MTVSDIRELRLKAAIKHYDKFLNSKGKSENLVVKFWRSFIY